VCMSFFILCLFFFFFFSSRRRHTRFSRDWSSDVCSSDLKYVTQLQNNELTVVKGHILSNNDLILRNAILDIICKFKVDLALVYTMIPKDLLLNRLSEFLKDNLLFIENDTLIVTDLGKAFVRNICMAFDEYLIESNPKNQLFSMTI